MVHGSQTFAVGVKMLLLWPVELVENKTLG
jgi:hypothetical protein